MKQALIVSSSSKTASFIRELLPSTSMTNITILPSTKRAKALIKKSAFDLCIINSPLPDGDEEAFALYCIAQKNCQVLLLMSATHYKAHGQRLEKAGIMRHYQSRFTDNSYGISCAFQ